MMLEETLNVGTSTRSNRDVLEFFVTGCSGFIGTHLVARLIESGHVVIGYDLKPPHYSHPHFEFIEGDILDLEGLQASIMRPDGVFHLAAQTKVPESTRDPAHDFEVNARGTFNVLSCAQNARFIYASTSTVYGSAPTPTTEAHAFHPVSFYGASKAVGELYCFAFNEISRLPTISLRLYNVYGPGNAKGVMFDLITKLQQNPYELEILGTGLQMKDYVYIDDVVDAFLLAYYKGVPGSAYNVGRGGAITVNDIAACICKMMNLHPVVRYTGGKAWEGDIESTMADISAFTALGWKPRVDLETGLENLYKWMQYR
ncbi:MAG: NAD-dependent epimerase/dehydratase family protein [Halobacteriota archaeon]